MQRQAKNSDVTRTHNVQPEKKYLKVMNKKCMPNLKPNKILHIFIKINI